MGLGMSNLSDNDVQRSHSPRPPSVINELLQRLTTLWNQLGPAVELSSSLQTARRRIKHSAPESEVVSLETLVKSQAAAAAPPPPSESEPKSPSSESLTQMVSDWKKSVEGWWSSAQEEGASERELLVFARLRVRLK
jgi:hypothetical protein